MRKIYIKTLTNKDRDTLNAFTRVGCLTKDHLSSDLELSNRRIQGFLKDNYIEQNTYLNREHKTTETYFSLTDKGKQFAAEYNNNNFFYKSNSAYHDVVLADKYFTLSPNEQDTWKTETQLREEYPYLTPSKGCSPTDASYTSENGKTVMVEVITQNYSRAMREMKEEFVNKIEGATYEVVRA